MEKPGVPDDQNNPDFFIQATWESLQPQKLLKFFAIFTLKVAWNTMNFGKFDQKTVEKRIINIIFKQQVISVPQKLQHFSRAWALVAYELVACKKEYSSKTVWFDLTMAIMFFDFPQPKNRPKFQNFEISQ